MKKQRLIYPILFLVFILSLSGCTIIKNNKNAVNVNNLNQDIDSNISQNINQNQNVNVNSNLNNVQNSNSEVNSNVGAAVSDSNGQVLDKQALVDKAWEIFEKYKTYVLADNIEGFESVSYINKEVEVLLNDPKKFEESMVFSKMMFQQTNFQKENFTNVVYDDKQLIISDNISYINTPAGEQGNRFYIYFSRNGQDIKLIMASPFGAASNDRQTIDKLMKDTDGDGRTDEDEACKTEEFLGDTTCIKTNINEKDTDGDGYWDNIEILTGHNPNNPKG